MATIEEVVFIVSFICIIGIMIFKVLNALNNYKSYEFPVMILLFICGLLFYGLCFSMSILSYDNLAISQLQKFAKLPMLIILVLTVIETFFLIHTAAQPKGAYRPQRENGRN